MFKELTAVGQICSLGENLLILLRNQEQKPQDGGKEPWVH